VNGYVYLNLIGLGVTGMDELALKSYDQAISLDPVNPYYPTQKGMVYLTNASVLSKDKTTEINQNLENAKAQFEKAIQLKSDYASPRYQIAMVYQAQGKTNEEFKALEETKKYSPNDVGLAFQIGLLYYQKADYTNAKAEFERTIALNSDYANALYFLSLTYYKLGQNDKAIQAMQRVVDLNPDNADIKTALENLKAGKAPVASLETPAETPIEEAKTETTKK
jgi:tetratricopeptide (TPR) repeat protein